MSVENLIALIKNAPISSVIGRYIQLKKKGNVLLGLCPFHNDSRPSLTVNDDKQMFMCFACQTGGDAISFVQKFKNIEFMSTLQEISEILGIPYDEYVGQKKTKSPQDEMALNILTKTSRIYSKIPSAGKCKPFNQFIQSRKLSEESIKKFSIGYASSPYIISDYLNSIPDEKQKNDAVITALKIGLIKPDKKNPKKTYDKFRNRIMFPVWNQFGNITGFCGRAIDDSQPAKYMNSDDSFCFNKKNILFGLHLAKNKIREKQLVIVVEGHMDLIILHQHGFENSVAIMGVALGEQSIRTLKALSKNFILALDSDSAGFKAMERIHPTLLENGILPKYINFSPYKDPDEFIQNEGPLEFQRKIDESIPFLDVLMDQLIPETVPEVSDRKLEILKSGFQLVSPLEDSLIATERLVELSKRLALKSGQSHIIETYKKFLSNQKTISRKNLIVHPEKKRSENEDGIAATMHTVTSENSKPIETKDNDHQTPKSPPFSRIEKILISELASHPEYITRSEVFELSNFLDNNEIKRYVEELSELVRDIDENEYPSLLMSLMNQGNYSVEIKQIVGAGLFKYQKTVLDNKIVDKFLLDVKMRLQKEKLKERRNKLRKLQKDCTKKEEEVSLIRKLIVIDKELNSLKVQKLK